MSEASAVSQSGSASMDGMRDHITILARVGKIDIVIWLFERAN